jgi:1-acyl-sn-glycerol-3-phosphate acyltransferase
MMTSVELLDFPHQPRTMLAAVFVGMRLVVHLLFGALLAIFYPRLARDKQRATLQRWSGQLLAILHITLHPTTPPDDIRTQGGLLVANHVSWLDIFVLNAVLPTRFVAKIEVRDWFLIGWLCRRSGTLFVKRETRQHLIALNQVIADALKQQEIIGLFPEGTSSEGCEVGEFYPALFQGAVDAAAPVLPACLYYHDPQGKHSQLAAYAGNTSLAESIWRILRCHDLHVSLTFSPPLNLPEPNRRTLSRAAHAAIVHNLHWTAHEAQSHGASTMLPTSLLPSHSAYTLLLAPVIQQSPE